MSAQATIPPIDGRTTTPIVRCSCPVCTPYFAAMDARQPDTATVSRDARMLVKLYEEKLPDSQDEWRRGFNCGLKLAITIIQQEPHHV